MIDLVFFGTPQFSAHTLSMLCGRRDTRVKLVVTQPDRPAGRGKHLLESAVKRVATEHHLPLYQPTSLKRVLPEALAVMQHHGPFDLGVVVAFGQILPRAVLDAPARGCVNIHASLLPRWRGAAPIQRAIMAGDGESGVCLMQMDEGLDTGGILAQAHIPIGSEMTGGELHDRLSEVGAALLDTHLDAIVSRTLTATPQSEEGVTYAAKLTKEEGQLEWSRNARELHNLIRALAPVPGAFTSLRGKRLKILAVTSGAPTSSPPGFLAPTTRGAPTVACGDGESLELRSVQLEGKRVLDGSEFLRGIDLSSPLILGE